MSLEATVILVDNSEWARNGDYAPTRFGAQRDCVNIIANSKIGAHPESVVGLMTLAGSSPEMLAIPTNEHGNILNGLHRASLGGEIHFEGALQVAHLALKHRANKNQRQRIIVFVGSPIGDDQKSLVRLGRRLKKNNIAVDVISLGEVEVNDAKLQAFIEAVNSGDTGTLLSVKPGSYLLSDSLRQSSILGGSSSAHTGGDMDNDEFEFGVDPSLDPELAMALRMSLAEEQNRQNAAAAAAAATTAAPSTAAQTANINEDASEEDRLLQQALEASMHGDHDDDAMDEYEDDDEIQRAIAMSMQVDEAEGSGNTDNSSGNNNQSSEDVPSGESDEYYASVLRGLHGNDPSNQGGNSK